MKSIFTHIFLCCSFCLLAQSGGVTFTASADARQVLIGSYFDVSFTLMNANGENFKAPSFDGFNLLSGPNRSISTTSVNGRYSKELIFSYTLQPQKTGVFEIDGATVMVNGKLMTTNKIKIEVLKGKSGATSQSALESNLEKDVFIRAVTNVEEAYIGQQILLDYKIYTALDIETYNLMAESEYDGFFMQEIRRANGAISREVINGVEYSTKILKRVALFPQQAGAMTIDPMEMRLAVVRKEDANKRQGFFQRRNSIPLIVKSPPLKINVRPLPAGAPPTFTGAVGKYHMNVVASRNDITTDEAITLTMTLTGNGDLKQVQAPPILIDKVEVYEPRVISEQAEEVNGNIVSEKVVEYLLLPQEAGRYNIAPLFTYFDTDSSKYVTLKASDNIFDVKKGVKRKPVQPVASEDPLANADIKGLKTQANLSKKGSIFFGSVPYWILLLLPVGIFGGVVAYRQKQLREGNIDQSLLRRQRAAQVATKQLAAAAQFLENKDSRAFYNEISRASLGYISNKLNIATADLSKHNIKEKLEELYVPSERITPFIDMLKTCEMALYSGMDNAAAMKDTYDKAAGIIGGIEEGLTTKAAKS
jgi:BatD DUF11 like domain